MDIIIICTIIIATLISSLVTFLRRDQVRVQHFSLQHFYTLVYVYIIVMIGFGLIYFVLASEGYTLLKGEVLLQANWFSRLGHSIYFSGVTLMTVGYGDITPVGFGRTIALVEALIGYILPAAFFIQIMHDVQKESE